MASSQTWRFVRQTMLALLLGSSLVSAQSASTTSANSSAAASSTASSTSGSPQTHTIDVALGGFTFTPDVIQAEVGDFIQYNFYPTNHSVARAQYMYPCIPYEDTGVDLVGFFSGFKPVDAILDNPPTYTIQVNDTDPIFYYCTAPGSCINYGMIGVINPNASTSLSLQKQLAENSTFMLQPNEPWPSESTPDPFSTGSSSVPTSTSSSSSSPTSSPTASPTSTSTGEGLSSTHHSSLSSGAIAGIAIGAAAVAILAAALLYLCGRQSRRPSHQPVHQNMNYDPHMSYMSSALGNPNASKHMTMVSNHDSVTGGPGSHSPYASPALPGYVPTHDPAQSPPMRPYYVPSEALSPVGDVASQRSESPSQMMRGVGVPPYTSVVPQQHNGSSTPPPQPQPQPQAPVGHGGQVHEMYAPNGRQDQQHGGGFMNLLRGNSTRKSGAVERYG